MLCALMSAAGAFVVLVRARTNWDQDIWWHLAAGRWIAEHGQVPATDSFSQYGAGRPWVDYTWLFDVIVYTAYQVLGLRGIVLLSAGFGVMITATLYVLVRGIGAPPVRGLTLTVLAFYAMMPLTTPRPWLFSILFFGIELHIIAVVSGGRRKRTPRLLWVLPVVFVLWANTHILFVIGLAVLGAAAADAFWYAATTPAARSDADGPTVPFLSWLCIAIACAVATLVTPYHVHVYLVAFEYGANSPIWTLVGELLAPAFRTSPDWVALAIVLTAAGCIGWQARGRPVRVFWLLLFVFAAWVGFRSRRDTWVMVTIGTCIIAGADRRAIQHRDDVTQFPAWPAAIAVVPIAAVIFLVSAPRMSEERLMTNVARTYPAAAAAFIEKQGFAGPLYNHFDWGGYLIWRLPQLRVAIDGRMNVHGQDRIVRNTDTWLGKPSWRADSELAAAKIVIGPRDLPLASLLRLDDRFKLVYADPDGPAVVFVAR